MDLVETKYGLQWSITIMCQFLDSNFNEAVIDKISIIHEIAPI